MPGTLYVIATPLGNLEDISPRALRLLAAVRIIACEDTRQTAKLLSRHGISTPTVSCHKFNERRRIEPILAALDEGADVALVSDGGTPGISDPGMRLVAAAHDKGLPVQPVPGPSAVSALLSASGLEAARFVFDGFLPHRAGERRKRLRQLQDEPRTTVVYEAPHRILRTLQDIDEILGERLIVLGRELTKRHETILRGTAARLLRTLGSGAVRGEITLAISGAGRNSAPTADRAASARVLQAWKAALEEAGDDRREALRRVARDLGLKRAELNRYLAELGE